MKKNLPVTQVELDYPAEDRLISETDLRGIVTTANTAFCDVAGFQPDELIGKSHNLVRHPDVPPEAFADLWRTLKAGERWVGVIKNRRQNGDHYWVKAFVSPVVQDGRVIRYRSVRRKPSREEVRAAEALYRRIGAGEKGLMDTLGDARRQMSRGERLGTAGQLGLVVGWLLLLMFGLLAGASAGAPPALLWGLAAGGTLVALGLTRLVHRWITHPLDELAAAISAFEQGDLSARAGVYGRSRSAEIARVMNRALDGVEVALGDMGQMLSSLARGEFGRRIVATLPGELDSIKTAANRAADQIESTVDALNSQLAALAEGQLDAQQVNTANTAEGKFREAQENAAVATARLSALLREMVTSSHALAGGDLTQPIRTEAAGELAALCSHFNAALASLTETVTVVRTNARQVAEATSEISGAIEEIAAGANTQMSTIDKVTDSVQESNQAIAAIAGGIESASLKARETVTTVSTGRTKMERMVEVVQSIAASSEHINSITAVIEGIANKTNLLSLNAAIEAARAGEHGRGFAVVADEVGKLAISSAHSAQEIAELVRHAVTAARQAAVSVGEVSGDMDRIVAAVEESSDFLGSVAAAMAQQRATLAVIGEHSEHLSMIAQENAAATEQLAASSAELTRAADATYREAEKFRT